MFCKKCGKELKDGYKFCPKCGTVAPRLDEEIVRKLDMDNLIKSAESGDFASIKRLAFRYQYGIGVEKDNEKAKELFDSIGGEKNAFGLNFIPLYSMYDSNGNYTLPETEDILISYALKVAKAKTDRATAVVFDQLDKDYLNSMKELQDKYPELFCFIGNNTMTKEEIDELFKRIKEKVKSNYRISLFPTFDTISKRIQGVEEDIPIIGVFREELSFGYYSSIIAVDENSRDYSFLNIMLLQWLILLPIKKIKINIVDLKQEYKEEFFMKNVDPELYNYQPITTEKSLLELIERIEKRKEYITRNFRNYSNWCVENKDIPISYEFVIENFKMDELPSNIKDRYHNALSASNKMGVYRIRVFEENVSERHSNSGMIFSNDFHPDQRIVQACIKYINDCMAEKEDAIILRHDFEALFNSEYSDNLDVLAMPVGRTGNQEITFRLDLVSHVHSFIIGQSGSGKSVFLHSILGAAMLEYSPEDLQFYLLDFKLGGVEFNRYKDLPHVKALLVDNSDSSITLEILRELRDRMAERGKLMRDAGVNNLTEYNRINPEERMSQILLVVDECHEMFKVDESVPRVFSNEISEIAIKIAKEGRSQGVHLVFATQTLSGTEISSEIINNISDFYLLKCAPTDSERLVSGSSSVTSGLTTGQIYYHHVDEQSTFQAYYADRDDAEHLVELIRKKAEGHRHNGCFYFSGSQIFHLEDALRKQMSNMKANVPILFMGRSVDLGQQDICIRLMEDFSENVLLLGLNNEEQVTRTTMNMFVSLIYWSQLKKKEIAFDVIDCMNNDEGLYHDLLLQLADAGYCNIVARRDRSSYFQNLAQSINDGKATDTILLILGQDRFRELKMDMELNDSNDNNSAGLMSLSEDLFGSSSSNHSKVSTYREALDVILDKGPDYGIHTLMQLEKISNFLFADFVTPKMVYQKFKHLVMLRSEETASTTLRLQDNIHLEKLSSEPERLRAYYYSEESDSYTLLTPYYIENKENIVSLLKTL